MRGLLSGKTLEVVFGKVGHRRKLKVNVGKSKAVRCSISEEQGSLRETEEGRA